MGNAAFGIDLDDLYDIETIELSIKSFYLSTGINVTEIDRKGNAIFSCEKRPKFCELCRTNPHRGYACHQELFRGSKIAERLGEEYVFSCPAGLTHFTAPIVNGKDFWGALIGGPILISEPANPALDDILDDMMVRSEIPENARGQLLAHLAEIVVVRPEKVRYLSKLLFMVCCSLMPRDKYTLRDHSDKSRQQSKIGESIHYLKKKGLANDHYPYIRERELLNKVKNGDVIAARGILNELLAAIFYNTGGNISEIEVRILELCTLLSRASLEGGAALDKILAMNGQFVRELKRMTNIEEISFWLLKVLDQFTESIHHVHKSKNTDIMRRALNYINENYQQNITLEAVAGHVHLNTSYFSSLFKKEMGIKFSDYLNKIRIDKSKQLLVHSQYSILDIALMVGFEDQSYYSKVFKKMTGDTPREYRYK
jgi:two-component system response regulator YesN